MGMKVHIICVAYERYEPLEILIKSFRVQTNPDWVLHIIYDGPAPEAIKEIIRPYKEGIYKDERVRFYQSEERYQKYGHPNRRIMLQSIITEPGDFILMSNDDNYYTPRFIEFMTAGIRSNTGMVYCDTVHSHMDYSVHISELKENFIDIGAFMVRAELAKITGFNHDHFSADGRYAEECLGMCRAKGFIALKVQKPLFVHN
jgi:GT2 family glycosyltransferase